MKRPPHSKRLGASFDGQPFEDSSGRRLNVDRSLAAIEGANAIIVPGYLCGDGARFLAAPSIAAAAAWLRRQHAHGAVGVRLVQRRVSAWRSRPTRRATLHDDLVASR